MVATKEWKVHPPVVNNCTDILPWKAGTRRKALYRQNGELYDMSSSVEGFSTIFCDFKNYTNYVRSGMFLEVKLRKVFKFGRALTAQAQHIFLFLKSHEK